MNARRRIGVIYRKELLDVLRDRRTLTAMIVIPVVLYPVVMLVVIRAAETEQVKLASEQYTVEVPDQVTLGRLGEILATSSQRHQNEEGAPRFDIRIGNTPAEELGQQVHAQVSLNVTRRPPPLPPGIVANIKYNEVDIRSQTAMRELQSALNDYREVLTRRSLEAMLGAPPGEGNAVDQVLFPIEIKTVSSATDRQRGGWALAHVIPIILVLMTITGAIYPAIDLTAGERERGTLETVIVTPVPILHLIVGKFLVVVTIAMITAALNVGSVGATMHFSGLTKALSAEMPVQLPLSALPVVLVCLIPFALLFSAILLAVCSFARTFKEAQNYIMPVMVVSLIPAFTSTFPSIRLERGMLVLPVGNMVLLTRELLQDTYTWGQVAVVTLSTTLYAIAAIAVAAKLFGQEAVLFSDSRPYRTLLDRRYFAPADRPNAAQALLLAALMFPACFYAQTLLGDADPSRFARMMGQLAIVQFLGLLIVVPTLMCAYWKVDIRRTLRLATPPVRGILAAILIGASSWALANELMHWQQKFLPPPKSMQEFSEKLLGGLQAMPVALALLLIAIVPAVSEELFFRGFLLSGLSRGLRKWPAILLAALIFGGFHFIADRVPVTAVMGILLGYVCWQTRSIWPGMLIHAMHNSISTLIPMVHHWPSWTGLTDPSATHLPPRIIVAAVVCFVLGLAVLPRRRVADQ